MMSVQDKIRETAGRLLAEGKVSYVIGWGKTRFPNKMAPKFIFRQEDAGQLEYNEYCLNTLAKYLLDDRYPTGMIGLCVRGCESRAVNRLIKDKQVKRENLYLIGIPCQGMKREDGMSAEKCLLCTHRNPVIYDELAGEMVRELPPPDRFQDVKEMEKLTPDEKYSFWAGQYEKCIRCYACRNVCPACNCTECYVDQYRTGWQGKQNNRAQNQVYGLTRAFHVADRCIECGECERVCPMEIPLMKLNRKLIKDIRELFGDYEAGMDDVSMGALGTFLKDDLEEFM